MLQVELLCGYRNDQNGNEAVVSAASEAFARWLSHRYGSGKLPSAIHTYIHIFITRTVVKQGLILRHGQSQGSKRDLIASSK